MRVMVFNATFNYMSVILQSV